MPQGCKLFGKNKRKYNLPWYLNKKIQKLEIQGLIAFEKRGEQTFARLTEKGKSELERYRLIQKKETVQRWDGKWRVIIFDIKEYRRQTRNQLRAELSSFGFHRLQNSVWVSPHPCEEIIALLKADLKIGKDVLYILTNEIENDWQLKKLFDLHKQS